MGHHVNWDSYRDRMLTKRWVCFSGGLITANISSDFLTKRHSYSAATVAGSTVSEPARMYFFDARVDTLGCLFLQLSLDGGSAVASFFDVLNSERAIEVNMTIR